MIEKVSPKSLRIEMLLRPSVGFTRNSSCLIGPSLNEFSDVNDVFDIGPRQVVAVRGEKFFFPSGILFPHESTPRHPLPPPPRDQNPSCPTTIHASNCTLPA